MRSPLLAAILLTGIVVALALGVALILKNESSIHPMDCVPRETALLVLVPDPAGLLGELSRTRGAWGGALDRTDLLADFFTRELQLQGIPVVASAREISMLAGGESLIATIPGDIEESAGTAMIVDLRRGSTTMPEIMRQLTHQSLGTQGDEAWSTRSYHGRDYQTFHLSGRHGGISTAQVKELGIVTTSAASMRRILDTADGRSESLRSEPAYHATHDHLGKRGSLFAYASGSWIAAAVSQHVGPGPLRHALKAFGLDAITGAGVTLEVRKQLFHERAFIALRAERRGLMGEMFDTTARPPLASTLIPARFPFYLSLSFSGLDTLYRRLPEILSSATGEDRGLIRERLDGLQQFMAMDLDRDLFGALGGDLGIGFGGSSIFPRSSPERALFNTPAVAAIALNNKPAITRLLNRFDGLARALGAYHSLRRDEQSITSYEFAQLAPLSPAYRILGGHLVAATSVELLEQALDASKAHQSVADEPGLGDLLEQLPDRGHLYFLADTARMADLLRMPRVSIDPFGALAGPFETGLDALQAQGHLPPSASAVRLTAGGLSVESISPVSPSLLFSLWLMSGVEIESWRFDERPTASGADMPF